MSHGRPGTHLKRILESIQITPKASCPCDAFAAEMDAWGIAGCTARRTRIAQKLKENAAKWDWREKLTAGLLSVSTGLAFRLRIGTPYLALVEEAIRQAEAAWTADPAAESIKLRVTRPRDGRLPTRKSLVARAVKLAEATKRHIADDNALTPDDALQFRQAACADCPLNVDRECRGCNCPLDPNAINQGKLRWRSETCPAARWSRHNDRRRPLLNPTRNLLFHIYPLRGAEFNWHWHCEQIVRYAALFNGRIVIGIGTGETLAPPEDVQARLSAVPVTDWIIRPNTKQLAETATFVDSLKCVETDDPNSITFRFHTKGVTHRPDGVEQPWARLLWETNMDIPAVEDALASHIVAGSMMCHEPLVKRRNGGDFFYAGSAYWFRSDVFSRNWSAYEKNRWWVEYWPGAVATSQEAACLCHDFAVCSVLSAEYFRKEVQADWDLWRTARGLPIE